MLPGNNGHVLLIRTRPETVSLVADPPFAGSVFWPDPNDGPWLLTIWWRYQFGVPTPVGFDMRAFDTGDRTLPNEVTLPKPDDDTPMPRLDGQLLRQVRFMEASTATLSAARQDAVLSLYWQRAAEEVADLLGVDWVELPSTHPLRKQATVGIEGPRGRDLGDAHYKRVAAIYRKALAEGRPPTTAVMKALHVEKSTAAKQVARARARGFLPSTTRGRPSPVKEDL